ncbi:MAG: lipid II flippase MurJ [Kineosporiaceae bacterium]
MSPRGPGGKGGGFVRQSATSSGAALLAMLSGLLLDVAIATSFGATKTTDVFFVAAKIPVALAALLMTVATQTLVPAFVREAAATAAASSAEAAGSRPRDAHRARGRRGIDPLTQFASRVLTAVVAVGLALWGLAWLTAGPLVFLTAPGLHGASHDRAAALIPIVFLLVPLVAAAETVRSALNASDAFVAPAAMNLFMNAPAAAVILGWPLVGDLTITVVAWAYVAGAALQLATITAVAHRGGVRIRLGWPVGDPRLRQVVTVGRGSLGSSLLNLGNRIVEQAVASQLPSGSITLLSYGNRLISALGGGVFFRPAVVAMMPRLSRAEHAGDTAAVHRNLVRGLRFILVISVPLTAFTVALAVPVIRLVFHRGDFTAEAARILALVLAVYGFSLVGSGVQRILLAVFYARQDTSTPLRNTFYGVIVDLVLLLPCLVLAGLWSGGGGSWTETTGAVVGVAVAFSITQYAIVAHAWVRVRATLPLRWADVRSTVFTLSASSAAATGVMMALVHLFGLAREDDLLRLTLLTGVAGAAGAAVLAAGVVPLVRRGGLRPPRDGAPARVIDEAAEPAPGQQEVAR